MGMNHEEYREDVVCVFGFSFFDCSHRNLFGLSSQVGQKWPRRCRFSRPDGCKSFALLSSDLSQKHSASFAKLSPA